MTGRYNPRTGVKSASRGEERMDLDETTIFEDFKAAGYRTAAFGKWHNGMQPPYHPNARGVDEYYGFCSGHWGNYYSPMLEHNGQIVQGDGFLINDFTNRAMDYMGESKGKPFSFIYLIARLIRRCRFQIGGGKSSKTTTLGFVPVMTSQRICRIRGRRWRCVKTLIGTSVAC